MKYVGIVQSNYIPWKGYFDLVNSVDEFILYDDAQYTKRDWRNRNIIKTPAGPRWLTIPVDVKGKFLQKVKEAKLADPRWGETHWKTIVASYAKAPHFRTYAPLFQPIYNDKGFQTLSEVNHRFILAINEALGIKTRITWSMDYDYTGEDASEKLVSLCLKAGATHYLSGPAAKDYLKTELFEAESIPVVFFNYGNYPPYRQLWPPFDHAVTILDLIFSEGPDAPKYMNSFSSAVVPNPGA